MFQIFVRFGRCLCCLLPFVVNMQPPCPHTNSRNVLLLPPMHHRNLWCAKEAHSGGAEWVRVSRCTSASPAKKPPAGGGRLTKRRNLGWSLGNSGWVPVKSRRLQDWQKLKKYAPNHKHGAWKKQRKRRFGIKVYEIFSACLRADFAALVLKNATTPPPPKPIHFRNGLFSQISKSIHTPTERNFGALDKKLRNP